MPAWGPMLVIAREPEGQFGGPFFRGAVSTGISPFAQACLNEALGLAVIRYEIRRRLCARLFPKGRRRYGEPIRDTGRREHEGAGRPPIDSGLRARARYMAAPCDFPGCAVSADQ
jgi:hypothetical protein